MCPAASWGYIFFQAFPFPFPLLKFVSFYLASFFLESKPKAFQRISFSQTKKHEWSWYTIVWFVWGYTIVSSCFLRWFCFLTFPLHFPLLKFMSFIFSISFFYLEFSEMPNFPKNIWCLIKTQLKNITQTIFQGGSPWATLIHNSMVCLRVHYCVQLLPEVIFFFQAFPFPFPLLKFMSFIFSISFFYLEFSEMPNFPKNIWCLIKTQLKNITQTIFQGGSPWATLIHNSMVCLRVHYCVQLLPEVIFFSSISFPFSFTKVCFLLLSFILLGIKTKGFPKD